VTAACEHTSDYVTSRQMSDDNNCRGLTQPTIM